LEPGKSKPVDLYNEDSNARTGKFVLKEVDYEITSSAGTKEPGVWLNAHFQEDLKQARLP
jgi:hypothetical protein